MHPLAGIWMANSSQSRRDLNAQVHVVAMRFEISGNTAWMISEGLSASGEHKEQKQKVECSSRGQPLPGSAGVVIGTLGRCGLELVTKKNRAVMSRSQYIVSDAGETMRATLSGIDAQGRLFHQVIVFDRGERLAGAARRSFRDLSAGRRLDE